MDFSKYKYIILLVDSTNEYVEMMNDLFMTSTTCQVLSCTNYEEAIALSKQIPLNMIIFNDTATASGISFYQQLKQIDLKVDKILLADENLDKSAIYDQFKAGMFDKFLTKPFKDVHVLQMAFEFVQAYLTHILDERVLLEEQLIQNEKMSTLGTMLAGIAHELNNPIAFVNTNLSSLKKFCNKLLELIDTYHSLNLPDELLNKINEIKEDMNFEYLHERIPRLIDRSIDGAERLKKILLDLKQYYRRGEETFSDANINDAIDSSINIITHEHKGRITFNKDFGVIPFV
ncbi:MAG: hypothetical protein HQK75_20275, partial [Candidatus Magnetomorum sp.]|nr:hypothetical protein [Candidatus Magnetomorum sp.]